MRAWFTPERLKQGGFAGSGLFGLLVFNALALQMWPFGLENATEAAFFWSDEGRHVQMLQNIQTTGSLALIQKAYTALYVHLSYALGWCWAGASTPIPPKAFAEGSKLASLLAMNAYLVLTYIMAYRLTRSLVMAGGMLILLAGQSLNLFFATSMHPEAWMVLGVAWTLYSGIALLHKGEKPALISMALGAAVALGSKPAAIFLLPWMGLVTGVALWKHPSFTWKLFFTWGFWGIGTLGGALFVASPYQMWHFSQWFADLLEEQRRAATLFGGRSLWEWGDVVTSDLFLGPFFTILFSVALLGGAKWMRSLWKAQGKVIFENPWVLVWFGHVSWVILGGGYIVLTSYSFIHRYLMHIQLSMLWIIGLGGWLAWNHLPLKGWKKSLLWGVIGILGLAGIQGQWRVFAREVVRRERIAAQMPAHRQIFTELQQILPPQARLIYTRRLYIIPEAFPQAQRVGDVISRELLDQEKIEYLLVHQHGRPGMKQAEQPEDHSARGQQIQASIAFWKDLEHNGLEGAFRIIRHFPELEVTLYQRSLPFR